MPAKKGKPAPKGTGRKPSPAKKARPKAPPRKPAPAPPVPPPPPPVPPPPPAAEAITLRGEGPKLGASERERLARLSRKRAQASKEAGPPPDIEDPDRREACLGSLKLFCETYERPAFSMGWSDVHLQAIDRLEEAVSLGALYAFAMSRGMGKSSLCRAAAKWATLNALRRYLFLIGATDDKAKDTLVALKIALRFNELLAADFPEVCHYAIALNGIANRASGQTCEGESTLIEWSGDTIVYPTVPPPANWPKHWPLRADGMVPTSGIVIATSGLTGEGLRGSLRTLTTGEQVRPDLVFLDDPQTPGSARSKTQNIVRMQLVSADVLGMAGPGKTIAAVMPCTVIEPGDMVDSILDRSKHPLWRGARSGILRAMPTNLAAWDPYFDLYSECAQKEPPDFTASNAYYAAHRKELDEGAEATWDERKLPTEVSAIQHAMHLYFRDPFAFAAEYQNQPKPLHAVASSVLDAEVLAAKVTNLARCIVPRVCTRLTAFIDVGVHVMWYTVVAWDERFGGSVIDYGPYPEQARRYFSERDVRPALEDLPGVAGWSQDAIIYAGLTRLTAHVLDRKYIQEQTGTELRIDRCPIDANWGPGTDLVYEFCRRDAHATVLLPSHGKFIGASSAPMHTWQKREGEQLGPGWRISAAEGGKRGRKVVFDTNKWKTFTAERLRTPLGAAGCLTLFAGTPEAHELVADHCTAEYPVAVERHSGGAKVDEWKKRPDRENHFWDCLVGATVAASVCGLRWESGTAAGAPPMPKPKPKKALDIEALYRAANPNETW